MSDVKRWNYIELMNKWDHEDSGDWHLTAAEWDFIRGPDYDALAAQLVKANEHIMRVETLCDPAGIVAENTLARDLCRQLEARCLRITQERDALAAELAKTVEQREHWVQSYIDSQIRVQALRRYTSHPGNCRVYAKSDMDDCTCGLTALLKATQSTPAQQPETTGEQS